MSTSGRPVPGAGGTKGRTQDPELPRGAKITTSAARWGLEPGRGWSHCSDAVQSGKIKQGIP